MWMRKGVSHKQNRQSDLFLNSIINPKDRVGLVSYNSFYNSHSEPTNAINKIEEELNQISKPEGDAVYTELYGSLLLAVDEFKQTRGRRVIIILSDGENSPYFTNTKKTHPVFDKTVIKPQAPIRPLQEEGISVFVIHFGNSKRDRALRKIASQTGGTTFNVGNQKQLESIYSKINDQVLNEYLVTYSATMEPTDKKFVKVEYQSQAVNRFYFSSTVFGLPLEDKNLLLFIPFLLACLALWGLSKIKFEKQSEQPSLELLNAGGGKIPNKTVLIQSDKTVIGGANTADMTIVGLPNIHGNHATILFDEKKHQFTLVAEGAMKVNNKAVSRKKLESGDVIDIDGVTMVFDAGKTIVGISHIFTNEIQAI